MRGYELYVGASGITAGPEVKDIFFTLTDTGTTYVQAQDKLNEYFTPRKNTSYNCYIFRQESQKQGETVAQYVTRLRLLGTLCEFGEMLNDFLRDQVIDHCISKRLRTRLLAEKDLSLDKTLEVAAAMEASERQSKLMSRSSVEQACVVKQSRSKPKRHTDTHNKSQNPSKPKLDVTCNKCGIQGQKGEDCRNSKKVKYFRCHQIGHFKKMCLTKDESTQNQKAKYRVK